MPGRHPDGLTVWARPEVRPGANRRPRPATGSRTIAEHHEDMRRVCLAMAGDHGIAEEAVQAAWLVAWKKIGNVHGPDQLRPWLVSVAVSEARQLLRKRQRRAQMEIAADTARRPGTLIRPPVSHRSIYGQPSCVWVRMTARSSLPNSATTAARKRKPGPTR